MKSSALPSAWRAPGLVLGSLLLLSACSATPAEVPPQTHQGLVDLRNQLVGAKAQIQKTTDAARDLVQRPMSQIEPQIDHLANEVQALETMSTQLKDQYQAQQAASKQYFAEWNVQLKAMTKQVREAGMERREQSIASFETLDEEVASLREDFRPYMDTLSECATYLRSDPTPAGVKSITPRVDKTIATEKTLMKKIDAVVARIDDMRGSK